MCLLRGPEDEKQTHQWRLPLGAVLSAYAIADIEGDGATEIVVGRLDGFLFVVNGTGDVERELFIGRPIRDVVVVPGPGGRRVALATDRGLVLLNCPDLERIAAWRLEGTRFVRIMRRDGAAQLVAVGDGSTKALALTPR